MVDGGVDFDGVDDVVEVGTDSSHDLTDELTISLWFKPDVAYDSSLEAHVVLLNRQAPEGDDSYLLVINKDGRLHLGSYGGNLQSTQDHWQAGVWYHVVVTYRSNLIGELYVNGSEEVLYSNVLDSMSSVSRGLDIGGASGSTYEFFDGVIDEVRLLDYAVDAGWVSSEYWTMFDPDSFFDVGAEEEYSSGDVSPPEISGVSVIFSDPKDTVIGWGNITCQVTDNTFVDQVKVNLTYPDMHTENVSMTKTGDFYYYNSTLSNVGSYSYFIWANDTSTNTNRSSAVGFDLPPNWDITSDGICNGLDVTLISLNWLAGDGSNLGWIRVDINNDGWVNGLDVTFISLHWLDTWS